MTFLEAAIEILRDADAAMHFAEVAKLAVDRNLLSHVGRDPEAAMRSCLTSAVRAGRDGEEPIIVRDKPGHYGIRPGAALPEPRATPAAGESSKDSGDTGRKAKAGSGDGEAKSSRRRRTRTARGEAPAPASIEVIPVRTKRGANGEAKRSPRVGAKAKPASKTGKGHAKDDAPAAELKNVEFEAPIGSGLDGVTDVAVVMANAMSRLVEERPELREELDAIQHNPDPEPSEPVRPMGPGAHLARDRSGRDPREGRDNREEDRSGRRRRRRRRRGKRVDWSAETEAASGGQSVGETLLDGVATALGESGPRSLHVRQIAETLAQKGLLGGEVSEIERAVTAEILLDLHRRGRASRFVARGDARYQLQGTRLPEGVAKAEQALREAARALEHETQTQLLQWLHALGSRALESLVRVWLSFEGYSLHAALAPNRGLAKLIAEDPDPEEDDGRTLVVVVPRRTALEAKLWEGELERNTCAQLLIFCMGEPPEALSLGDTGRIIYAGEFADWLTSNKVAVSDFSLTVRVLEPTLIESIAGLDT